MRKTVRKAALHKAKLQYVAAVVVLGLISGAGPCTPTTPISPGGESSHSTIHHHVESCWLDSADGAQVATSRSDNSVDMMLFVVGLNHQHPDTCKGVDVTGVRELADAIVQAWPNHPERIVVISSSFFRDCGPSNGVCLKNELESRYPNSSFAIGEVDDKPHGTTGVIAGSRWRLKETKRVTIPGTQGSGTRSVLRDTITPFQIAVYGVHTIGGPESRFEVLPLARQEAANFPRLALAPIIAGDFNYREADGDPAAPIYHANFRWLNRTLQCSAGLFSMQYGNVMHALAGRISAPDHDFSYASACGEMEPVRLSYSVDVKGRLAMRPARPDCHGQANAEGADWNGIITNHISHNVIAIGLHAKLRPDSRAFGCNCSPDPCADNACSPSECHGEACESPRPFKCTDGTCVVNPEQCPPASCQGGLTRCGARCVNLNIDRANCGSCGRACPPRHLCELGECKEKTPPPRPCPPGTKDCGDGVCARPPQQCR